MSTATASKRLIPVWLALACLGADEYRPTPRFAGKSIPDPPRQKGPWTPPDTKLPGFLVSATAALFEQGVADPRGCEYREVEFGDATIVKTRGFVFPRREGEVGRFAVGWDGVVYPASSVGAPADLEKDIRSLADSLRQQREAATAGQATAFPSRGYWWSGTPGRGPSSVEDGSPLKLCLLLRLGRADLAESLFASATPWTPAEADGRNLTAYQVSYLILAQQWAGTVYNRLISAQCARRRRDRARCRAAALGIREGGRREGPGAALRRETLRARRGVIVSPAVPSVPRAARRPGTPGEGARPGADPEARG